MFSQRRCHEGAQRVLFRDHGMLRHAQPHGVRPAELQFPRRGRARELLGPLLGRVHLPPARSHRGFHPQREHPGLVLVLLPLRGRRGIPGSPGKRYELELHEHAGRA